jgi:hypothetical protein
MPKAKRASRPAVAKPENVSVKNQHVEVYLPPNLLKWAEHHAWNLGNTLSDLVRDLLEYEKLREEKPTYTTDPKTIKDFEDYERREAKRKAGAR